MQLKYFIPSFSRSRASAGALLILSTSLIAAPPAPLSSAQLLELDRLAMPMLEKITAEQNDSQKTIDLDTRRSKATDSTMKPFLQQIGQAALLVQSPQATPAPPAPPAQPVTPAVPATDPKDPNDPKNPTAKKTTETTLKVECDGGLYFDSENGVLVYLKNIRLTEPRFKLTCSDELKVFLDQKPEKSVKKPAGKAAADKTELPAPTTSNKVATAKAPKAAADANNAKKKRTGTTSFGELKRIVATGNVKVVQKDDRGRLFIASGGTASYDAKTGEMILKGGLPRLQQSAKQYLQAQESGQWIRIHKNGKLITSNGKWVMQTTTKKPAP